MDQKFGNGNNFNDNKKIQVILFKKKLFSATKIGYLS